MNPIDFPEANKTFIGDKSSGVDDLRVHQSNGMITSKWQLTPEDKELVARTGVVWLTVFGDGTPPVCVAAQYPFEVENQDE